MAVPALSPTPTNRTTPATTPASTPTSAPASNPSSTGTRPAGPSTRDTFEAGPVRPPSPSPSQVGTRPSEASARPAQAGRVNDPADLADRNAVPWISQLSPSGAAESHPNADFNCAPASFAMVARRAGFGKELSDSELISQLAETGKTAFGTGTSMNGALAMANAIGLPVDRSEVSFPGFDAKWMDEQLAAGKAVIANGALATPEGPSGHFIVITGKDENGDYKINDPLDADARRLKPAELEAYLARNPVHQGASIAVG